MTSHGRTPADVRRWPQDESARRALEKYFEKFSPDAKAVLPVLDGGGLDFTGADLSGLELCGAEFSEADLSGVRLADTWLGGAWLLLANLRNADISRSSLRKAQARGCDARGVVAVEADFRKADLDSVNLREADLRGSILADAFMPHADLRGADLRGCVLGQVRSWAFLGEARMAGCLLEGAHGSVCGPVDVGMDSPRLLDGPELVGWFAERRAPDVRIREIVSR